MTDSKQQLWDARERAHATTIALCTFALGVLITITDTRRYRAQANRRPTRQEHDV
jgi:hypothetical protein